MPAQNNGGGPPGSPAYLKTMPKFIREASPLTATSVRFNSAFPPLTTEKRYRGVYERAGFDVLVPRNSSNPSLNAVGEKSARSRSLSATEYKPQQRSHLSQPTEARNFTSPALATNSDTQVNYLERGNPLFNSSKHPNRKQLQLDMNKVRTYDSPEPSHPLSAPAFTNQSLDFNFGKFATSSPKPAANNNMVLTSENSPVIQADRETGIDQVQERRSPLGHSESRNKSSDSEYFNAVEDHEGYDSLDEFDSKFVDGNTHTDHGEGDTKDEISPHRSHDSSEHDQLSHLHQMNHEFRKSLPIDMAESELPSFLLNTPGLFSPQMDNDEQFKPDKTYSSSDSTPRTYNPAYGSSSTPIQYHEEEVNYKDSQSQMTTIQETTETISEAEDKNSITWQQADVDDLDDLANKAEQLKLKTAWDPLNDSNLNEETIAYSGTPETSPLQEEIMDDTINNSNSRVYSYDTSIEFEGHRMNNQPSSPPVRLFPPGSGPCRKCNLDITGKSIWSKDSLLSGRWHRHCFGCSVCEVPFQKSSSQCYVFDDRPYCSRHFHELNGSICHTCDEVIEGQCLENEALEKFHLHCLVCSTCSVRIYDDYFVMDGKALCEEHGYQAMQQHLDNQFSLSKPFSQVEKRRTHVSFV